jgi:hypothetical protein
VNKQTMSVQARRQFVTRATKASARLEMRVVPAHHVRTPQVEHFVAALRAKA